MMLASANGHAAVVNLLLKAGAEMETTRIQIPVRPHSDEGETALIAASKEGQTAIVKLLLEAGANKDAKGEVGKRASDYAIEKGHTEMLYLLEQ